MYFINKQLHGRREDLIFFPYQCSRCSEWRCDRSESKGAVPCCVDELTQRTEDYKNGEYKLGGGVVDPLPEDAPFFVKDYYDYYKTDRGYHARSLNSNNGWNAVGTMSFLNQPILKYSNEIRSAVLIIHGEKAHSCYMGKDAYEDMVKGSKYADNKELMIIPDAVHTDLYDGGGKVAIPFDKLQEFFERYL